MTFCARNMKSVLTVVRLNLMLSLFMVLTLSITCLKGRQLAVSVLVGCGRNTRDAYVAVANAALLVSGQCKLQALVYILPSATAVFSYVTGSRKLSANEQVFVGTQTVVSLLQRT